MNKDNERYIKNPGTFGTPFKVKLVGGRWTFLVAGCVLMLFAQWDTLYGTQQVQQERLEIEKQRLEIEKQRAAMDSVLITELIKERQK